MHHGSGWFNLGYVLLSEYIFRRPPLYARRMPERYGKCKAVIESTGSIWTKAFESNGVEEVGESDKDEGHSRESEDR